MVLCSCDRGEVVEAPTISYPVLYTFDTIKYETGRYFVLTGTGQNEITIPSSWQYFEEEAFDIVEEEELKAFQKIELQSDLLATLWINPDFAVIPPFTNQPYTITNGIMTISPDSSILDPLFFNVYDTNNTLRRGLVSTHYSFRQLNGTLDYGIIETMYDTVDDYTKIVQRLRTDENLKTGDTVSVKLAGVWYK
jgi:hypothetical protein